MRKALFYSALLIGGYLVLVNYTGAVKVTNAGTTGATGLVQAFQGR